MNDPKPFPWTRHLMRAYFHQDFDDVDGTEVQVVAAFLREEPQLAGALADEIATILSPDPSEAELRDLALGMGSYFLADWDGGTWRGWFESIEAQARAAV